MSDGETTAAEEAGDSNVPVEQPEPLADNAIILFGEIKRLDRPKGRRARLMMPRLINFLARAINILTRTAVGQELFAGQLLQDGGASANIPAIAEVIVVLTNYMGEEWDQFDREILPTILQCNEKETARLEGEGDIFEIYTALYRAIRYYMLFGFSEGQREALGKLFAEAERRAAEGEEEEGKNERGEQAS